MNSRKNDILQHIPRADLSPRQAALRPDVDYLPVYTLRKEPTHLEEIDWTYYRDKMMIWRDNGSVILIHHGCSKLPRRDVFLTYYNETKYCIECSIYGETDKAVAETVAFWSSLQVDDTTWLRIEAKRSSFMALSAAQVTQILEANPARLLVITEGVLSVEQSVVLATRSVPLYVKLVGCPFPDKGIAFIDALKKRHSSFGALQLKIDTEDIPYLNQLLQLHVFETLVINSLYAPFSFRPLCAPVKTLEYEVYGDLLRRQDFSSLNIVAKDLKITFLLDDDDNWSGILVAFLNRVAALGHFERLTLSIDYWWNEGLEDFDLDDQFTVQQVAPVADALVRAIQANPHLKHLDVGRTHCRLDWAPHLQRIFQALEDHPALRTVVVQGHTPQKYADDNQWEHEEFERMFRFDDAWLERLLSRNRNLTVLNNSGDIYTNGSSIDKIYALNRFYHGSASLVQEFTTWRPLLLATALVSSTSLQYTSLLLSDHTDLLCEFIQEIDTCDSLDAPCRIPDRAKRKLRIQPPRAVKRVARDDS
ncbi:hypothetical protein FisN_10Lu392 [Fistulifera solaris]|uniref:Uncharacterized protein n=1 Tax=Fistulifera solaris TaxID=1519565 RepID=A0A1Z5JUF0_FISSO|nr:hypothetical protein FisN_10Lu392 [Fistulifera solaris]|eukprot:GAX17675.1 hypothetical protein FisN_10Lu392 [Fistulifera solaris]